jgi:hypothetical protein
MSAADSIRLYSDLALDGSIRSLSISGNWAGRLHLLLCEKQRRQRQDRKTPNQKKLAI